MDPTDQPVKSEAVASAEEQMVCFDDPVEMVEKAGSESISYEKKSDIASTLSTTGQGANVEPPSSSHAGLHTGHPIYRLVSDVGYLPSSPPPPAVIHYRYPSPAPSCCAYTAAPSAVGVPVQPMQGGGNSGPISSSHDPLSCVESSKQGDPCAPSQFSAAVPSHAYPPGMPYGSPPCTVPSPLPHCPIHGNGHYHSSPHPHLQNVYIEYPRPSPPPPPTALTGGQYFVGPNSQIQGVSLPYYILPHPQRHEHAFHSYYSTIPLPYSEYCSPPPSHAIPPFQQSMSVPLPNVVDGRWHMDMMTTGGVHLGDGLGHRLLGSDHRQHLHQPQVPGGSEMPNVTGTDGSFNNASDPNAVEEFPQSSCAENSTDAGNLVTIPANTQTSTFCNADTADALSSSIEVVTSCATSEQKADVDLHGVACSDLSFLDGLGVPAVEISRSHTPPERDVTSNSAAVDRSDAEVSVPAESNVKAELVTELNVSYTIPLEAETDALSQPPPPPGPSKPEPFQGPSSLAFTIDFGPTDGNFQITDHWTHPTPFRSHPGMQRRTVQNKSQKSTKEPTRKTVDTRKLPKPVQRDLVRCSASPEGHSGYHSDGHGSGASSDNESASVRSEVASGFKVKQRHVDTLRKGLMSSGCPSQSQPSLVQTKKPILTKPSQKRSASSTTAAAAAAVTKTTTAAVKQQPRPTSAGQSRSLSSRSTTDVHRSTSDSLPASDVRKSLPAAGSKEPSKLSPSNSSTGRKNTDNKPRKVVDRPKDVKSSKFLESSSADTVDVTAYLIDRMLGRTTAPLDACIETKGRLPKVVERKTDDGDNHSDAGTYTIDEDEEAGTSELKSEVQQARDSIGQVFGIFESNDAVGSGNLVRPVIESHEMKKKSFDVASDKAKRTTGDDVFGDDDLHDLYKRDISEAVSNALTATNQAIQHVLGLESRRKGTLQTVVETASVVSDQTTDVVNSSQTTSVRRFLSEQPAAVGSLSSVSSPPIGTASSDDQVNRQCATVVCDSGGDFGTFIVSYDAPSPRLRQSITLESTPSPTSAAEPVLSRTCDIDIDPAGVVDSTAAAENRLVKTDNDSVVVSVEREADVEKPATGRGGRRIQPSIPRPVKSDKMPMTGLQVARSVGDVSRVFANEPLQTISRTTSNKGRKTPPPGAQQTAWSCWRKDVTEMSDAGSEAESSYSVGVGRRGDQRRTALRSAPVVMSTRTNRTFALRCAAKQRADEQSTPGSGAAVGGGTISKPNRSRSAENNARLALASRSRSGSRVRSPNEYAIADWRQRQPSSDSTGTNISLASHDGVTFTRRDGGRFSMRVEKSNTSGSLASLAKQLTPWERSSQRMKQPAPGYNVADATAESKELTAWKRRKDYDARKSVAQERAKNAGRALNESPGLRSVTAAGQLDVDEIAMLSNAVAYNLNVLSQTTQSEAVALDLTRHRLLSTDVTQSAFTAVNSKRSSAQDCSSSDDGDDLGKNPCDAVLVNSIQQMSCKVKTLTDKLMAKMRHEGQKLPDDHGGRGGMPESWQNSSPELTAILDNLKRTEQHLQTVHSSLFSTDRQTIGGSRRVQPGNRGQFQAVTQQRMHHVEQAGFKPIDNPVHSAKAAAKSTKSATTTTSSFRAPVRRQSTGGAAQAALQRRSSESSENPLSGDEYY